VSRHTSGPPGPVRWLLRLLLPESEREFYLGDLEESGRRSWASELASVVALRLSPRLRPARGARAGGVSFRLDELRTDVRLGLRRLRRSPAATFTVLTALSMGIGMTALIVSLIDGALLPALPFPAGERIVRAHRVEHATLSVEAFEYWMARQNSFEGIGAWVERTVNVTIDGERGEPVQGAALTATALPLLSVQPALGRLFTEDDAGAGAPAVVLVGHGIWRTRLNSDPDVLGRTVRLNGEPAEIIGVMPADFGFPMNHQLWTPLRLDALRPERNPGSLSVFGVLRAGVPIRVAASELNDLDAQRARTAAEPYPKPVVVKRYTDIINPAGRSQLLAGIMLSVAFVVLLVACANATNVLLAQATVRSREVAVRAALGASRARIAMQFWIEVSMLALLGAVGGVLLGAAAVTLVGNAMPSSLTPFWFDIRIDMRVLAFVAAAAAAAAMLAGVTPALHASRGNAHDLLKDTSRGTSSRRLGLLMGRLIRAEMAVSFVLLVAAGLFVRSAINVRQVDLPFNAEGVFTSRVRLPDTQYANASDRATLIARLEHALTSMPAVSSATIATVMPGFGAWRRPVAIEGVDDLADPHLQDTRYVVVTPDYFATFGASVLAGRMFDSRDDEDGLPVGVVNRTFERIHFPDGAVGGRVAFPTDAGGVEWLTIVGVVPDLLAGGLNRDLEEAVYRPIAQDPPAGFQLAVRSGMPAAAIAASIREAVAGVDHDVALYDLNTMEASIREANTVYAWFSALFLLSGSLALFLAAIGLYGVMAFHVVHRTREIGVRMALGGERGTIVRLVLRQGMAQVATGLAAGIVLAAPVAWLLRSVLLDVRPFDPLVFGSVLGVLLVSGWMGCMMPAIQATRVDPQVALAAEAH
jgi:putative ABC transport system permease protein